jgi:hypothetical protein
MAKQLTADATYTGDSGEPTRVRILKTFGKDAFSVRIISGGTLPAGVEVRLPQSRIIVDNNN